jgi:hypothetical protein
MLRINFFLRRCLSEMVVWRVNELMFLGKQMHYSVEHSNVRRAMDDGYVQLKQRRRLSDNQMYVRQFGSLRSVRMKEL